MMSLSTCHSHTLVEDLQSSRGTTSHHARRTRRMRLRTWRIGTWNVQSMVDTEGCVEIGSRRQADGCSAMSEVMYFLSFEHSKLDGK